MKWTVKRQAIVAGVALLVAVGAAYAAAPPTADPNENEIRKVDEEIRRARVNNDTETLGRLVASEYYGINQNGRARDKEQFLELFKTFKTASLAVDIRRIRINGDSAIVAGRMREVLPCGRADCPADVMLFLRTYVRRDGRWLLQSNAQMRDPSNDSPWQFDRW